MNKQYLKLCLVTHLENKSFSEYKPFLLKAIQGGITSVQLREKNRDSVSFQQLALQFKEILQPFGIPLIINDNVEIAANVGAEGVHLGQSDLSPYEARKILGEKKIIGLSIESFEELSLANDLQCIDYIAASAVFPSHTKTNCKMIWGIDGLRQLVELSNYPVIAIGGINSMNVEKVIDHGACGAAVISAIHQDNPEKSAADLITKINHAIQKRGNHVS